MTKELELALNRKAIEIIKLVYPEYDNSDFCIPTDLIEQFKPVAKMFFIEKLESSIEMGKLRFRIKQLENDSK